MFTPYSGYLYGESISYGERIAIEIRKAIETGKLDIICTKDRFILWLEIKLSGSHVFLMVY